MNNSYITIIKEKRTALSRKRVPLNQNECTDDFRIGVPFEQNLHALTFEYGLVNDFLSEWCEMKTKLNNGEISPNEYFEWKITWPQA